VLVMKNLRLSTFLFFISLSGIVVICVNFAMDIFFPSLEYAGTITIEGYVTSQQAIYYLDWQSENFTQLTDDEVYSKHPVWSLDGEYLAFIYLTDLSSTRDEGIGIVDKSGSKINYYLLNTRDRGEVIRHIAWSSDGRQILYNTRYFDGNSWSENKFYLLNLDNGGFQEANLPLEKFSDKHPVNFDWSSKDILALEIDNELYTVNLNTMQLTFLAEGKNPFWTPDGKWLTFLCKQNEWRFCKISPEGENLEVIPQQQKAFFWFDGAFTWSPDEQFILFTEMRGEGDPVHISVLDTKTGLIHRIYESHWSDLIRVSRAVWSPID